MDKQVQNIETGEVFIETSLKKWQSRLTAWKQNHACGCPMPVGHLMFTKSAWGWLRLAP